MAGKISRFRSAGFVLVVAAATGAGGAGLLTEEELSLPAKK
jgi:hypothetical protein